VSDSYEPLLENVESARYISEHFARTYNEGMELAKTLVESHPYEGAEMILALKAYVECRSSLLSPIQLVEVRRASAAGLSGGMASQRVYMAIS
jgi:hypothetical protein